MNSKIISKVTACALLGTMVAYTAPVFAYTKDETIYSKLDSKGNSYNTIVNNHIKNEDGLQIINDMSDLLNVENDNSDEKPEQNGNNLVWKAEGNDVYYQGESQKELPIKCDVRYELNGKIVDAKDIVGKNGKVKVTLEYKNKDAHVVNINGKNETLYTPFVVVCGTIIDNENNKNIEISNGKVVDNGNKTIVVGMCLPGMQESLNLSKGKLDIPDSIEITMDATDFELNNIVTYVTPKIIEDEDLSLFDNIDGIFSKVNTLQESSNKIEEGANTLKEGTSTFSEKSQEFNSAMNTVTNGMNSASQNYSKLDAGISTLNEGSTKLKSGMDGLKEGTTTLANGITTMSTTLDQLETGSAAVKNGVKELSAGLDTAISGKEAENAGYDTLKTTLAQNEALLNTLKTQVNTLKNNNPAVNVKDLQTTITTLEQVVAGEKQIIATMEAGGTAIETGLKNAQAQITNRQKGLIAGTTALNAGISGLNTGVKGMQSKLPDLTEGVNDLAEGSTKLANGTQELSTNSKKMKSGLNTLSAGSNKLQDANNQLTEGANTIAEGTTTLSEGISKFNKEGIQAICSYINGDLKDVTSRVEKLKELSQEYNNFTMLNDGNEGNVKFIMIIDSLKKEQSSKQDIALNDSKEE